MKTKLLVSSFLLCGGLFLKSQTISTFENLVLQPDTFWDGSDQTKGFTNGNAYFSNYYAGYWASGWAYSNKVDSTTSGFGNLFGARPGIGYNGSANYAVGQNYAVIKLQNNAFGKIVRGCYITNGTFAALSMATGDMFAKKFGGTTGNDPDWFKLSVYGYYNGSEKSDTASIYLADFRSTNNSQDYILKQWQWLSLEKLGNVDSLLFVLTSSDNGQFGMNTPAFFCLDNFTTADAFAPSALQAGTSAMFKDSTAFVAWAIDAKITRGFQNIANTAAGFASVGDSSKAIGKADGLNIVSLGDGGEAILTFAKPIKNGPGADFAVFENSFSDSYLELAFVEVSSDGINYYRFLATSLTQDTLQVGAFDTLDATKLNNLAGKYRGQYGTPFDLEELKNNTLLDLNRITHVKITDVIGSITPPNARFDFYGNKINDPWATEFASSGFDLDAVGVIHQNNSVGVEEENLITQFTVYPNPINTTATLAVNIANTSNLIVEIIDINGKQIMQLENNSNVVGNHLYNLDMTNLNNGYYFVRAQTNNSFAYYKLAVVH